MTAVWRNVPVPEPHVGTVLVGMLLEVWRPLGFVAPVAFRHGLGWPLLASGMGLAGWAVVVAGSTDLARPDRIVEAGPYRASRNPMYVGWTLAYTGAALLLSSGWLLALLPFVVVMTHLVVRREEARLEHRFGKAYRSYRRRVCRCF
jgi:protein-S-isoprenylcysteine O-methyltransferase Ste14